MKAAIYSRYSTEKQSEASIEDQFGVCERLAERDGFVVVARFSDAAASDGRDTGRPLFLNGLLRGCLCCGEELTMG